MRTDQIVRLLMETELPVGDIAESLGFSDRQHFARYFRAGEGISPLALRRSGPTANDNNGLASLRKMAIILRKMALSYMVIR